MKGKVFPKVVVLFSVLLLAPVPGFTGGAKDKEEPAADSPSMLSWKITIRTCPSTTTIRQRQTACWIPPGIKIPTATESAMTHKPGMMSPWC